MLDRNSNKEMIEAIRELARDKGVKKEVLLSGGEKARKSADKNNFARQAGYSRLGVISAVGTRGYYERLGFASPGPENPEDAATLYQYRPLI